MHLKSLEIQGFKSFPDKINIQFPGGITAIVGPNGSGKSNISDAIRWVLGEQSGKQLRSAKMEDVIFTGTSKRRPQGFAQVSLTIDNSDHALPVEYNEVTVSRRYYRSGESEYFINKQQVRLKDVNELFLDTGLGKDGYSIIGQGKIAEILSPKSDDRRSVIEEVAGISKYRYRKNEATRKLQSTEDNLLRLNDILGELSERLPVLESQSKKAKQYLEYRDEKTTLDISLWMYEIEKIREGSIKLKEDYAIAAGQLSDITRELENIDRDISQSFSDNQQINIEIENIRQAISAVEENVAEKQSAIAVLVSKIAYMEQDIKRSETEMLSIDTRTAELSEKMNECVFQTDEKKAQIQICQEKMASYYKALEELSEKDEGQQQKTEEIRTEIARLSEQKNNLRMEKISVETQISTLQTHKEETLAGLEQKKPEAYAVESEIAELNAQFSQCEEKLSELSNVESGIKRLSDIKLQAFERAQAEYEQAQNEQTQKSNRLQMLRDMEKHLEGYQGSVKLVLKEAEHGRLQGICGSLSQLIRVPQKYITAIETALGGAIQNIVAKTEKDAKKAIFLLKSQNGGRVTILPLDTIRSNALDAKEFTKHSGFLGVAADLVETEYPKAVQFLLGKVLVVDELEHATTLAGKIGHKYRIVTLDGQVVNVGGSLTGGSAGRSSGLLSRGLELEKISDELKKAETVVNEKNQAALKAKEEYALADAKMEGLRAERETVNEQMMTINHLKENKQIVLDSFQTIIGNMQDEISQCDAALELHRAHLEQCDFQSAEIDKRLNAEEEQLLGLENLTGENQQKAEQIKAEMTECQMQESGIFKEIEGIDNMLRQYELQIEQINADKGDRLQAVEMAKADMLLADEEKAKLEKALEDSKASIKSFEERSEGLIKNRSDNERQQTSLRSMQKDKLSVKEKLLSETSRLENRLVNITERSESLIGKLMDEYNLSVTEAEEKRIDLEDVSASKKRTSELRNKMRSLGNVNLDSIEEYAEVKKRHDFLKEQVDDLTVSKRDLEKLISELLSQMKTIFTESFNMLNEQFDTIFKELFGGGRAELILEDPEDVLGCNIDIKVAPPGKIIKNILSLSGGEQAFSAIALYFAILKIRPTPFCVMDEIEAALDDVNVARFAAYLRKFSDKVQFVTITHRRGTMEEADVLYGVTMQEKGVSKLLTINVGEMEKQLKLNVK